MNTGCVLLTVYALRTKGCVVDPNKNSSVKLVKERWRKCKRNVKSTPYKSFMAGSGIRTRGLAGVKKHLTTGKKEEGGAMKPVPWLR